MWSPIRIVLIGSFLSTGCSSDADFASTTRRTQKVETSEDATGVVTDTPVEVVDDGKSPKPTPLDDDLGGGDKTPPKENAFSLSVTTSLSNQKKDEPVELLFVVDNSQSMTDNVNKLKESTRNLFAGLNTAGLPYRARIMTVDKIDALIEPVSGTDFVAPRRVFGAEKPNYDRSAADEQSYLDVSPFGSDFPVEDIADAIGESVSNENLFNNEPGVCAALDYINWTTNTKNPAAVPFRDGQKIHVVSMSDEQNVTEMEKLDSFTGAVLKKKNLICYQENQTKENCETVITPKKYKEASWTGYGFRVIVPAQPKYTYTFNYQPRSTCQARGAVPYPDGTDQLVRLYGLERCHKKRQTCRDTEQITQNYICQAGDSSPKTSGVNLEAQNKAICEVAQEFRCEQLVDGVKVWLKLPRDVAIAEIINKPERGLACEPIYVGSAMQELLTSSADDAKGIRSCAAYACTPAAPVYATVTIDKAVVETDPDRYLAVNSNTACTVESDYYHLAADPGSSTKYYKFLPSISGGKFTAIKERVCSTAAPNLAEVTTGFPTLPNGDRLSETQLCLSQLLSTASTLGLNFEAMGVAIRDHQQNGPATKRPYTSQEFSGPKTKAEVAQSLGIPVDHIDFFENYTEQVNPGSASELILVYANDRYEALKTQYGAANVYRLTTTDDARVGPKTVIIGSPESATTYPWNGATALTMPWNATDGVTTIEKTHPTETVSMEVCGEPTVTKMHYAPTPDNFLAVMKKLHPKTALTWHSIVNVSGESCPDAMETNVSKGSDYLALSKATKGLVEDICEPDFEKFTKLLTVLVIEEVDVAYPLPETMKGTVTKAVNKATGKSISFEIVNGSIVFRKEDLTAGDEIEVAWK